jgi:hypothetical protein
MGWFCLTHHARFAMQRFDRIFRVMGPSRFLNMCRGGRFAAAPAYVMDAV